MGRMRFSRLTCCGGPLGGICSGGGRCGMRRTPPPTTGSSGARQYDRLTAMSPGPERAPLGETASFVHADHKDDRHTTRERRVLDKAGPWPPSLLR